MTSNSTMLAESMNYFQRMYQVFWEGWGLSLFLFSIVKLKRVKIKVLKRKVINVIKAHTQLAFTESIIKKKIIAKYTEPLSIRIDKDVNI